MMLLCDSRMILLYEKRCKLQWLKKEIYYNNQSILL